MTQRSILIVYFSHSGNTRVLAEQIRESVGGDLFPVVTAAPYPAEYDAVLSKARGEQKNNSRPALINRVVNMDAYDTVFVGYPNWWATMPMAMFTFLETYDFSGKKIAPFCTHGGSALGRSVRDIKELCPRAVVLEGLAIRSGSVGNAKKEVQAWLSRIGIKKELETA